MKILIIGGYGVFGGRLAELLSDIASLELVIGGRSLRRAAQFCEAYRGQASVRPLQVDRDAIEPALAAERPALVVDASGPFQEYGAGTYRVVEACIAEGIDYLDFADAADFVFGISRFDEAARQAGVFVLSGVSSFPVLTAAVLREMARTMDVVAVEGGIAPSPYAGIGLNVMRAVVGYAGGPVKLLRDGKSTLARGLCESMRFTIAVPGRVPLANIHFSLVDVPDLQVIPPEHPTLRDIWMGAGPLPEFLHRVLNALALARATLGLPSLVPLSGLFYRVLDQMKFGEHRGGMFVRARGLRDDRPVERTWHLLAEGDDGPYIPSMAIEAIVRKCLAGQRPAAGARPATRALELADYEQLFANRSIYTGFRDDDNAASPLYRELLGSAFDALPGPIRQLHELSGSRQWVGKADVRRGRGVLARIVAAWIGFPKAGTGVPLRVTLSAESTGERWTREFAGRTFSSFQRAGTGRHDRLLLERFGPIEVALALVVEDGRLALVPRRWSLFGIPLPRFLLPRGTSFEAVRDGRFGFDVEVSAPVIGLIVAYKGQLDPA